MQILDEKTAEEIAIDQLEEMYRKSTNSRFRILLTLLVSVNVVFIVLIGQQYVSKSLLAHRDFLPAGHWTKVFGDEFKGVPSQTVWARCYPNGLPAGCGHSNNERQWYRPENVHQRAGFVQLVAEHTPIDAADGKHYEYTSGMLSSGPKPVDSGSDISTNSSFSFQYGYAEARMKMARGAGIWPAFWLKSTGDEGKEIDITEVIGSDPTISHSTIHWNNLLDQASVTATSGDFSREWHTFGVNWQPNYLAFYIDGFQLGNAIRDPAIIPHDAMFPVFDLAVGGTAWVGQPDATTKFPQELDIDWIHVFQSNPRPGLA